MREWAKSGGRMGSEEARKVVVRGAVEGAGGEWGEKVKRVWEFLVETGGLRRVEEEKAEEVVEEKVEGVVEEGEEAKVEVNGVAQSAGAEEVPMDVGEEVREVVHASATLASAQVEV